MNTDEQILQDFLEGSEFAFTSIYNNYADKLLSYGIGLGFSKELLEDAIQDVFVKLHFNRKQLKEVANLRFYLFRSLKNRLLDIQKAAMETSQIDHYELKFSIKTTILDELIAEEDKMDIQNKVNLMLECLTSRQREAIYLRFIHEMDYEEIGKLLDMTPQSVRKLVSRGIGRIRDKNLMLYFIIFVLSH
jgi:RNA polymerase sigma factor (sigma-70 family)